MSGTAAVSRCSGSGSGEREGPDPVSLGQTLMTDGFHVRRVLPFGARLGVVLRLEVSEERVLLFWDSADTTAWRLQMGPQGGLQLGWASCIEARGERRLALAWQDFELVLEAPNEDTRDALLDCLALLRVDCKAPRGGAEPGETELAAAVDGIDLRILCAKEASLDSYAAALYEGSLLLLDSVARRRSARLLLVAWRQWASFVRLCNQRRMAEDRSQWRLHAVANADRDLQAWYHAAFGAEVYRLRGPFWHREAALGAYRGGYCPVDSHLTRGEEAVMSTVLCSPDTTYVDVAAQLYTCRELLPEPAFALFERLLTEDVPAMLAQPPRASAKPKSFRVSFVRGGMYLTWKGKYGTQGTALNRLRGVADSQAPAPKTKRREAVSNAGQDGKPQRFGLTLECDDKAVQLCLESAHARDRWRHVLTVLANKERNILTTPQEAGDGAHATIEGRTAVLSEGDAAEERAPPSERSGPAAAPLPARGLVQDRGAAPLSVVPMGCTPLRDGIDPLIDHFVLGCTIGPR